MRVSYFGKIFDFVFGNLLVFFVAFVWTRFFWSDQRINIAVSFVMMILVCLIYNYFAQKRAKKTEMNKMDIQNAQDISNGFLLSSKADILKSFEKHLSKKYSVKIEKSFLHINGNILYPVFDVQEITDKEILAVYQKTKNITCKKTILVCHKKNDSANEITQIFAGKQFVILDCVEAYKSIYKPLEFDVPKFEHKVKKEKTAKQYLSVAFSKKNTKNYFMVSAFLLFGSFVLRYNIYYLVFASITTIFALYSHFNKRFNISKNEKLIENM